MTDFEIQKCVNFFAKKSTGDKITFESLQAYLGYSIKKQLIPLKLINKKLHSRGYAKTVMDGKGNTYKIVFSSKGNKNQSDNLSYIKGGKAKSSKKKGNRTQQSSRLDLYNLELALLSEEKERKRKENYERILPLVCGQLASMELYEKLYVNTLKHMYPELEEIFIKVSDINQILHEEQKEVTFLNGYYVRCELGFHEKRVNDLQKMRMNSNTMDVIPGYRDDISNMNGTFHMRRDESGRIASELYEDNYDD